MSEFSHLCNYLTRNNKIGYHDEKFVKLMFFGSLISFDNLIMSPSRLLEKQRPFQVELFEEIIDKPWFRSYINTGRVKLFKTKHAGLNLDNVHRSVERFNFQLDHKYIQKVISILEGIEGIDRDILSQDAVFHEALLRESRSVLGISSTEFKQVEEEMHESIILSGNCSQSDLFYFLYNRRNAPSFTNPFYSILSMAAIPLAYQGNIYSFPPTSVFSEFCRLGAPFNIVYNENFNAAYCPSNIILLLSLYGDIESVVNSIHDDPRKIVIILC